MPAPEPEKPTLIVETTEISVSINSSAILECRCKGYPKPNIIWEKDGKQIEPNEKFRFLFADAESMSLIIRNIKAEDAGNYTLKAVNDLGEDTANISLNVKCKSPHLYYFSLLTILLLRST